MSFNVQLGVGDAGISVPTNRNSTITCQIISSRTGEAKTLYADGEGLFSNSSWTIDWKNIAYIKLNFKNAVCNESGYTLTGYQVKYYLSNQFERTVDVTSAVTQISIKSDDGSPITGIIIYPTYTSSGGGGGGVSYVTGNVWAYPDQNAGFILFNGNQATQQQGNIYSYTFVQGSNIQLTAVPKEGYEFLYWNDGVTNNPWNIGNRAEGFGANAFFQLIPQTKGVNIYQNGNWENTGAVKKYQNGEWVDLPAHIYRNGQWEDL